MKQLRAERGKYNGKDYSMVVLRKVILYPLEAGAKTIEPLNVLLRDVLIQNIKDETAAGRPIQPTLKNEIYVEQ